MNPLSAFSFGKIIKTFIPGLIASVGVLFIFDLIYQVAQPAGDDAGGSLWQSLFERSFFSQIVLQNSVAATVFGAFMIPLSLMLGFFTNTLLWQFANSSFRAWVEKELDPQLIAARRELKKKANAELKAFTGSDEDCEKASIETYFLPMVDFEKFSYVRESYFSWFEFQANSALALVFSYCLYALTVLVLLAGAGVSAGALALSLILPLVFIALFGTLLVFAAKNNLLRYQERVLLFLVCCVTREGRCAADEAS
ncbi:MAG: hypothetical protein AAF481_17185 [Acidobacteriota bacterium]